MVDLIPKENFPYSEINKHTIQGFLYSYFKESCPDFHDAKGFKFFCYSDVFPHNDYIEDVKKTIIVSSPDKSFIDFLNSHLEGNKVISGHPFEIKSKAINVPFNRIWITGSPVVLYKDNKKNLYFSFERDKDLIFFLDRIKDNALRKFNAFYNEEYYFEDNIFDRLIFSKEVVVNTIKKGNEFIIIGSMWKNLEKEYISRDDKRFYSFLMESGIGEKNSMGFGFVNPVKLNRNKVSGA
ncbi:MAG: CRISPR associated protein Cas6 [Candidatus Methanofastidiosum methylothiophilum]|uniref:CRISPR associated protein Cas6 n=1 Tax=Candidatus Methanofastidiosum methylothiophilum TaxID=1705564 RepID=A0A150IIH1_9EURY|nr:MAG: CRISPR associated protein Cas6 [Candidatus Methanofastidiosum methylthiophilus]KYC46654.1 MAG: CRISPR associated protein Cas6 [Candidatus Methanofastidiosum methylthiophilus]KYC49080.1 MAG: CRISPR associated protein Cas6 [Candidatus Methanofastidiosum methylthiophilus]